MSRDHFDIVDCDAALAEAAGLADKVIDWMVGVGIAAMPATDAPHGRSYPKGTRLGEWAAPPALASDIQRQAEGVEVEIGRKVFRHERRVPGLDLSEGASSTYGSG
jgi:hypothetical protein